MGNYIYCLLATVILWKKLKKLYWKMEIYLLEDLKMEKEMVSVLKYTKNGARYEGLYLNDVRHGKGIKITANGVIKEVEYKNGIKIDNNI
jgi:hypothetical protein